MKLLKNILIFSLCILSLQLSTKAAGFVLDISVPRVSKFQLIQYHKRIHHGDNIIGQFILENIPLMAIKLVYQAQVMAY